MNIKLPQKDTLLLLALLIISFISVYYFPVLLNRIVFLIILFAAYRTKLDYVYLVWFFIINDAPGRLFAGTEGDEVFRIPLYTLVQGYSFSFQDFFILLYIVKFAFTKRHLVFIFKKEFLWFFIIGGVIFLYSLFFGMSLNTIFYNIRNLLPWSLIFIVPFYIQDRVILERLSILIFPIVLLAFASQIYVYITGDYLVNFLKGIESKSVSQEETELIRSYSAAYIILVSIIQAMYFFYSRSSNINKTYLSIIILSGIFSIFLTATRGWIIGLSLLIMGIVILSGFIKENKRSIRLLLFSGIAIFIILSVSPFLKKQILLSYERLTTLESLVKGDITAEGTLSRLDVRGPRVMAKFYESPVIGWGFSDEYHEFEDAHVGNFNLLMSLGVLGFIYLNGLFFYFILRIFKLSRIPRVRKYEGNVPLVFALGLLVIFVIHSSSTQYWGYLMYFDQQPKILSYAFLFASSNCIFLNYFQYNPIKMNKEK